MYEDTTNINLGLIMAVITAITFLCDLGFVRMSGQCWSDGAQAVVCFHKGTISH